MTLPLEPRSNPAVPRVSPRKIVIVDDEPGYGEMLRRFARPFGVQIDTLSSQTMGRDLSKLDGYDLVLLSFDMETCTGLEVAEFLGRRLPHKPLVMVASSPHSWESGGLRPPTVRAVVNKWDGLDQLLAATLAV